MTTARLAETLDAGRRPVVLLDVREAEEYSVSHLPAAHHAPSVDAALRIVRESPPDAVVVAYCSVGVRSSALAARLRKRGVAEVHNLQGSLFAWANEGRPVYRGPTRVAVVHPFDAHWGTLLETELHGRAP
ncbi:MAG: rhodanese-like domain-containing protein [Acidobacteria bacterium]|nr:rhodanese-like domain-containing protein [Acidobacteriota bacterium]